MQTNTIPQLIIKHYQLSGTIAALPGEHDLNFKLTTSGDEHFIVKIMRPDCDTAFIEMQFAVLEHLQKHSLHFQIPKVLPSIGKKLFENVDWNGEQRILWLLTFCSGHLMANYTPHSEKLIQSFGSAIAQLTNALEGFEHPYAKQKSIWQLTEAMQSFELVQYINDDSRVIVERIFEKFKKEVSTKLKSLAHSVIHNDANDYNVLVSHDENGTPKIAGIFDFGDMAFQPTICEAAIAMTYALLGKAHPLRVCFHFLKAYSKIRKISEAEIEVLFDLIKTRLAISIAISSHRQVKNPDDPYIIISQEAAKAALLDLSKIPEELALCFFRKASRFAVHKNAEDVLRFLNSPQTIPYPVMKVNQMDAILDLSIGSLMLGADPKGLSLQALTEKINAFMKAEDSTFAFGRYGESRGIYAAANFGYSGHPTQERRTIHLGIDIFCEAGLPVYAPFDGTVEINTVIDLPLDYGGLLILRHHTDRGVPFFTLYGHLRPESLTLLPGQNISAGDPIALLGEDHENGGWPPHLHLQLLLDLAGLAESFPGVAFQNEIEIWKALSPNPMFLFDVPDIKQYDATPDIEKIFSDRKKILGYNLSLTYQKPLHIISGFRQFLYDSHARTYLDFYNNVPHVGHQHPKVVKAIQQQVALLNTNTRYLHENITRYAERLCATLPDPLSVCYFVNSASEANELALRMARAHTGRRDIIVVASAYHGHSSTLIDISPYKHNGPGGHGAPDWVHCVPVPDTYRGKWKKDDSQAGLHFAKEVKEKLSQLEVAGKSLAAFIAETYPSVGGQIIPPKGYLKEVYKWIRKHGALCIADEVQTGFGRLGKSFWAFETQEVVPDIVVFGKPIANGFPMAAVVTTKEIASSFDNGMEFFSTFGGNPVACAAAHAVMDVIEEEQLCERAEHLGNRILSEFEILKRKNNLIGDVRGEGLFLGIELVKDPQTKEPAKEEARYVLQRLRDFHILAGIDGPLHNVLKFRPSMVATDEDVDYFIKVLDRIFEESFLN